MPTQSLAFLALCIVSLSHAAAAPVLGLWENLAVANPQMQVLARTNYVFTDRPLREPTVFSGLQTNGTRLIVVCCVKVSKLAALDFKAVLQKYAIDPDFGARMKSVKGLPYLYEAEPVDRKQWTSLMTTVMGIAADRNDGSPYSVPVIAATFDKQDTLPATFPLGAGTARLNLRASPESDVARYEFVIDGKATAFSERLEPHD